MVREKADLPLSTMERHRGKKFSLLILIESLLVGFLAGLVVVAYRFALTQLSEMRNVLFAQKHPVTLSLILILLIGAGYVVNLLLKWAPYSGGSGIPQIHAELLGRIDYATCPTLISKFFGGALNAFAGLSLGREGPSIQLGGTIGKLLGQLLKLDRMDRASLMAAGASAGLSAAFNAPLAGMLFVLEEIYGTFSSSVLVPALLASLMANVVSFYCLGDQTAFHFRPTHLLDLSQLYLVLPLAILASLVGMSFNLLLDKWRAYAKRWPKLMDWRFSLLFLFSFGIWQVLPEIQGGGHSLVEALAKNTFPLSFLCLLLVGKLVFTCISFDSGAQGGIFLPVLVLGATSGVLFQQLLLGFVNLESYRVNFMIIGMVAILTAVVRSPILSVVLIAEMTGTFSQFLSLSLASIVAYVFSESLKVEPVYHTLYKHLIANLPSRLPSGRQLSMMSRFCLPPDSKLTGKKLKDLKFPCPLLVTTIIREGEEFVPEGEDCLLLNDQVLVAHESGNGELVETFFKQTLEKD